jgi:hypothetical protein
MKVLKSLAAVTVLLCLFGTNSGCRKRENEVALSFTLSPSVTTALNVKRQTCNDIAARAFDPTIEDPPVSGSPGVAKFQKMTITWKSTTSKINIYAMRISGTDSKGAGIDITMTAADFWSFVYGPGLDTTVDCEFCTIEKSNGDVPWTVTINDSTPWFRYNEPGKETKLFGCGPVLSGLPVPKGQVGDVNIALKATLLAYSEDDAGNVNNEYATFPFTVKFQAPP